jgi:perosamine synthetase
MVYQIPFAKPSITEREIKYACDAAANGWGIRCYDYLEKFERTFASYLDTPFSIATSSCTGALHIAIRSLSIGHGDEVIVPEVTWIGSVAPITYEHATPVFVDVDPKTWCISPQAVEAAITPKTKAIIAVHLYGNLCDMHKLRKIADKYNLVLIEDAAEALGSSWQGLKAGSIGDIGVFSFHGTKTMTTGEGGMLVCRSESLYTKALIQSNHGRKASRHASFWMDEVGLKYKLSNIQAAIGLAQIERIEELIARKREVFHYYNEHLMGFNCQLNCEAAGDINSYWLPAVIIPGLNEEKRDSVLKEANKVGIGLRPFFYPLTRFPMFSNYQTSPVAASLAKSGINLPSYHDITNEDMDIILDQIVPLLNRFRSDD